MLKLNLPLVGSADDSMDADSDGDEGERENGGGDGRGGGGGSEIGRGDKDGDEGGEQSGEEGEEGGGRRDFWKEFSELVVQLRSLQLLHFIADSAVAEVVYCKVRGFLASTTPFLPLMPPSIPLPSLYSPIPHLSFSSSLPAIYHLPSPFPLHTLPFQHLSPFLLFCPPTPYHHCFLLFILLPPHFQVKTHMGGRCSQEFDSPMLEDTISSLEGIIMGWLGHVYGMLVTLEIVQ